MGPAVVGTLLITGAATRRWRSRSGCSAASTSTSTARKSPLGARDPLPRRGDDRRAVDRDGPVRLHVRRAALQGADGFAGALALRLPDAADRDPHHRPDAARSCPTSCARAATRSAAARSRTIRTVVLPTAAPGIVSGALLAVARAAGETAPLLFTIGLVERDRTGACSTGQHRAVGPDLPQRRVAVPRARRTGPGARRSP